jgi:Tol biopolymer transport system component
VSDPQLSPDSAQIIYTRGWIDKINDKRESSLWIMNADGSKNRFLVRGSNARWSPNGDRIVYTAQGDPKGSQIFVRYMDAEGAISQITHLTESPANVTWSPDGQSIAFAMKVEKKNAWPIKMPERPKAPSGSRRRASSSGSIIARTDRASTTMASVTCSRCRRPAARRGS